MSDQKSKEEKKENGHSTNEEKNLTDDKECLKSEEEAEASDIDLNLPTPPDGGWGWMIVFGSFMIHVIADGVAYSFGIFVVELLDYYHGVGRGAVGWIPSILIGVTWGSGPIASALVNKYGCRIVAIAGSIVGSIFLCISIFSPNIYFMYFSVGVMTGLGLGLAYLPAIISVSYYFEKKRAFATGLAVCGSGIGTFIFAPLTAFLVETYAWKGAMLICSGLLLNCVVCGALFRPLEESFKRNERRNSKALEMEDMGLKEKLLNGEVHNGHVPNIEVTGASVEKVNSDTAVQLKNSGRLNRRKSISEQALPYHSQPIGLHNMHKQSVDIQRHASENLLHHIHRSRTSDHTPGPMNRKDIFYQASLTNIPMYRSNPSFYTQSVMSLPGSDKEEEVCCCLRCCSPQARDTIQEMTDFSLLKDPVFLLFGISNLLTSIGFCVPYAYVPDRAQMMGVDKKGAAFLLSVIGIANTIGRVVFGWIGDRPNVNRLMLYNTALVLCGLFTGFSSYCTTFWLMILYCAGFGCFIGVYVALTPVVLVDLLGLDALTNSFGLTLLFQGIGAVLGPPIAGWIFDATQSYDPPFWVTGIIVSVSGLMLYCIPCLQSYLQKRKGITQRQIDLGKKVVDEVFVSSTNVAEA